MSQIIFTSTSTSPGHPAYADRNGQSVQVVRELSDGEIGRLRMVARRTLFKRK